MGFEQLAALKEQLAMQAKAAAPTPAPTPSPKKAPRRKAPPPQRAEPVDPVIIAISRLQRRFPLAFPKNPAPKIPLKIGILQDIYLHSQELGLNEAEIKQAVKTWCESRRYWACMVDTAPRIDLLGTPVGTVTAQEAQRAKHLARGPQRDARRRKPAAAQTQKDQPAAAEPAPVAETAPVVETVSMVETPPVVETATQPDAPASNA